MEVGNILQGSELEEQIKLETDSVEQGVARYRNLARQAVERGDGASLKPAERMLVHWFEPLVMAVDTEKKHTTSGRGGTGRSIYGPVILNLSSDKLAVITMHEMVSRCMMRIRGDTVQKMCYAIGNAVLAEINNSLMKKHAKDAVLELDRKFKRLTPTRINRWAKMSLEDPVWERKVCTHVGAVLMKLLMGVANVSDYDGKSYTPAFEHHYVWVNNRRVGHVRMTDEALTLIEDGHLFRQTLRPKYMPMLCSPYPWGPGEEGGYIQIRTPFITKPTREHKKAFKDEEPQLIYSALNVLNGVGCMICPWMTQLQQDIFDSGGGVGCIPSPDLKPMPAKPSDIETNPDSLKAWKAEAHEIHSQNAKLRGARIEFLQRMSISKKLLGRVFYHLYNLDFRTRFYPLASTAPNFHGDDASRSQMLFAASHPLNETGRYYLYLQIANLFGKDKISFEDRVEFVETNRKEFEDWARNARDTTHLWGQADKPFQFIHACRALIDPELASRLPGQIDGTCNGQQHYAADAKDPAAAARVNLIDSLVPNDPYNDVVSAVAPILASAADAGGPDQWLAVESMPYCTRKTCKQPTMTRTYNSTRIGARNMVMAQMVKGGLAREKRLKVAHYLSGIIYDQVSGLFPSAHNTMTWIEQCIRMMIQHDPMKTIRWTSPMGSPIIQPYRNTRKYRVRTVVQEIMLGLRDVDSPVSMSKQVQGGPANVVHTWDADHAKMTALDFDDRGHESAWVHDMGLAHLNFMPLLGYCTRHQFVEMHSANQSGRLYEDWSTNYPGLNLPLPPEKGNFDLEEIYNARHFFS